jgi:hypothetical protein
MAHAASLSLHGRSAILGTVENATVTADDFFRERRRLEAAGKSAEAELDAWEDQLRHISHTAPDTAAHILTALTRSRRSDDRETAAIYVAYLFDTRREHAINLLQTLFEDSDINVKRQALGTIDQVTDDHRITATEAHHITTAQQGRSDTPR